MFPEKQIRKIILLTFFIVFYPKKLENESERQTIQFSFLPPLRLVTIHWFFSTGAKKWNVKRTFCKNFYKEKARPCLKRNSNCSNKTKRISNAGEYFPLPVLKRRCFFFRRSLEGTRGLCKNVPNLCKALPTKGKRNILMFRKIDS